MMDFLQGATGWIVPFLFVLTLVVTIHEMGHFYAARAFGIAIERFAIGFGRPWLKWRDRYGTFWQIGWIPLGGYVRFSGDENAASVPDKDDLEALKKRIIEVNGEDAVQDYFHFKPLWQRAIVVAAGPMANFLLAIVLYTALLTTFGDEVRPPLVTSVIAGSAAEKAGFKPGDVILQANGKNINTFDDLQRYVAVRGDVDITFDVERNGAPITLMARPETVEQTDRIAGAQKVGRLGLGSDPGREQIRRVRYNLIEAVPVSVARTWDVLETTVYYLSRLVRGQVSAEQLGGPIRIAQASGAVAQAGGEGAPNLGWWLLGALVGLLSLSAVLSISIGFMNLLPIPVLDGGHLLFYAFEAVARRPLDARVQAAGYRVGLALLMAFMLFATWNDLQRLSVFKFIGGLFS